MMEEDDRVPAEDASNDLPTAVATVAAPSTPSARASTSLSDMDVTSSTAAEGSTAVVPAPMSHHAFPSSRPSESSSSSSLPSSFYHLPPPFLPPFHSRVLASATAAQMWILTIHQFYHAPASWGKGMAHMVFAALKEELRQSPSSASTLPPSLLSMLTGRTWEGHTRSITLDEFMARFARFPKDYAHQLWREFITSKSPMYPSLTSADPADATGGHSLLNSSNHSNSPSLLEIGRNALLPSMRKMATRSDASTGGTNILCGLLHRRIGTSSHRIVARASPLLSTANARATDLYARGLRKLKLITGHISPIYCVTFDRTGQRFFTGSDDFLVKVWDAATGRLVQTCRGHEGNITEISVSPDNLLVASASEDGKIRVWDINGIPVAVLRGHTKAVMRVIFVPNFTSGSRLLISVSLDGTARLWDCSNLSQPPLIVNAKSRILAKSITYFPLDLEGLSWNAAEADGNFSPIHTPEFLCISIHPLGTEFVVGHNDKNARVYDMKQKCVIAVLSGHTGEVENVSYSHSGNRIVTISESGEAFIWGRVEADQVSQAANTVNYKLPTSAPSPPEWNEQLMHATSHYAGLARAVAATPAAAHSYRQPVHPATSMAPGELLNPPLPHDPNDPNAIPTHRYIIVATLRLPGSMKNLLSAQPPAVGASSSSSGGKPAILSAIWSQSDDYIFGCTSSHSVVVWHIPSVIASTSGGPLEMIDPFILRRQEEAAYAASKAKQQQNRATSGRTKRSSNKGPDRLQPKPVTFLSCFKRSELLPTSVFNVHTANIQTLSKHPTIADLFVTSGADGRVAFFDVRSGRVLRVFHEHSIVPPLEPVPSPMSDGCFSPACTAGDKFVLANENGQVFIYGMGLASTPYLIAPEQQYFVRDSMALTRDQYDHVIDTDSQRAPHLAPGATTLCDLNGVVYSHPLPNIPPMKVVGTPVERIIPNVPSTRVLTLNSTPRVQRGFWLLNAAGTSPSTDIQSVLHAAGVEPADEPFNGDFWRTNTFSRALAIQNASDFYANSTAAISKLIKQTWEQDLARLTYMYQVKQAFQQQISLLKIAFQSASGPTAPAIDFQQLASNWYPALVLPLSANSPLVKYDDVEQLQVTRTGEDEASEGETRYLRQYAFDGYGTAWKLMRHLFNSNARPHVPRPSFPRRQTTATPATPNRARALSSSRATGTPSRPLAIDVDGGDDDYFDDDFQPDGGDEPASSLSIRAQARQLQRFETLRNRGRAAASSAPAASASAAGRPRNRNPPSRIQYREMDEDEEKKMLESGTDAEQSEYSDAEAAGNAEEEEEEEDEGEEDEADEYEEPRRRTTTRRSGGGRRRKFDDDEDELTDESSEEESEASGSESSDGDSDGSYRRARRSSKKKKKDKKKSKSRKRRRDEDSSEEDDYGESEEENDRDGRARKRAALNVSPKIARNRGRSKFYGDAAEDSYSEDADDLQPTKRSAGAVADTGSGFDERLYNPGNWLQRPLVQIYNSSYVPQLGDRVLYMRQGHESSLNKNPALPRTHLPDPNLPPLVHALVARVEYVWFEDAEKTSSSNRLYSLPKNHSGDPDASYCRKNEPPPIFARLTLVPLEDVHKIYNSRHPSVVKSPSRSAVVTNAISKEYDFSTLPPPTSAFHLTSVDTDNMTIRLRKIGSGNASGVVALGGNKMILPSRQSLRSALNQRMHDAPASSSDSSVDALTSAYMKASASAASASSSSSSSSRSPQKKGNGTRIILRGARSGAPEALAEPAPSESSQSNSRSRQPKRPDPYELQQMKEEELKVEKEQNIMRVESRGDCLQFPPTAFTVDLFEPQGADWLILLSRLQVSQSAHPAQWSCGEKFRMKYSDESDWSVGFICANALVDEQSERKRPTRGKNVPLVTAWESLRITWRSEEEIQAALNAAAEERSKSLVADPLAALPAEVQAIQRRMQLLEQWGQEASENDIVSPWEIDTLDRVTIKIESLDTWAATAESKDLSEKANNEPSAAAASSSSSPTVKVPELAHVLEPDALIDTTEYLSSAAINKLLPIIEKALDEPLYGVFCEPVPRDDYPIYAHAVPYACDLSTIQTRLRLRWYRTVAAVVNDCIAIRRAALLYNALDSDIAQAAIGLEQTLLRQIWHAFKNSHQHEFEMFIHTDNEFDWNTGDDEEHEEEEEAPKNEHQPAVVKTESHSVDTRMEEERKDNQSSVGADQAIPMDMDDDSSQAKFLQAVAAANSSQSESKNPA